MHVDRVRLVSEDEDADEIYLRPQCPLHEGRYVGDVGELPADGLRWCCEKASETRAYQRLRCGSGGATAVSGDLQGGNDDTACHGLSGYGSNKTERVTS